MILPPGMLRRREHTIAELQLMVGWLNRNGHHQYARRARAVLLHRLYSEELIYVVRESMVGKRQLKRYLSWYREGGLRRLLSPLIQYFRQCCRCGVVGLHAEFRSDRSLCLECHSLSMRRWRSTKKGAAASQRYNRSASRRRSLARYFASPLGREARQRAYYSSTLRAFRADEARVAGL